MVKGKGQEPAGAAIEIKRRPTRGDKSKANVRPQFVRILLADKTRQRAELVSSELLCIPDIQYLEKIAGQCEYLYDLVSRVLEVDNDKIKLYVQNDGNYAIRMQMDGIVSKGNKLSRGERIYVQFLMV